MAKVFAEDIVILVVLVMIKFERFLFATNVMGKKCHL